MPYAALQRRSRRPGAQLLHRFEGIQIAANVEVADHDGREVIIGTAGWSIPRAHSHHFTVDGTHLQRYSCVLSAVEINSCFYRRHAPATTYARWASATPPCFRFAVKLSRTITHEMKLRCVQEPLDRFLEDVRALGSKRGPILIQLPPSLAFDAGIADEFFGALRGRDHGNVACEPRHGSWFCAEADRLLARLACRSCGCRPIAWCRRRLPGGWRDLVYFRLHGSPDKYWSSYGADYLDRLARTLHEFSASAETWCILDNTASGAAVANALGLATRLRAREQIPSE